MPYLSALFIGCTEDQPPHSSKFEELLEVLTSLVLGSFNFKNIQKKIMLPIRLCYQHIF